MMGRIGVITVFIISDMYDIGLSHVICNGGFADLARHYIISKGEQVRDLILIRLVGI